MLVFQHAAHHLLALAVRVGLGVVEKVDAVVIGDAHELVGMFVFDLTIKGYPTPVGQGA